MPPSSPPHPEETQEEQENPVQSSSTAVQPSELPAEVQPTSSVPTTCTSDLTATLQSGLKLLAVMPNETTQQTESNKEAEEDSRMETLGTELKVAQQTPEPEKDLQPFVAVQFDNPTGPTLYPSLSNLEGSVLQLSEETVKNCGREPAVLALPEQESSPLSLQPLKCVAELSGSKLYPELPKTAPEMQVQLHNITVCCYVQ